MQLSEIKVDQNMKELTPHKTQELPMQVYTDDLNRYALGYVNWHWHDELEFAVCLNEPIRYLVEENEIMLQPGQGIFINSGVLHQMEPARQDGNALAFSICFSTAMIAAWEQGNLPHKYILPALSNPQYSYYALDHSEIWHQEVLNYLEQIYTLNHQKGFAYELDFAILITQIWKLLITKTDICSGHDAGSSSRQNDTKRISLMLEFIMSHYMEEITIQDIADSANISKSECFRCFRKMIDQKPFEYLLKYRIEQSLPLLHNTSKPITEIATACGFNSSSYFGAVFHKHMRLTPSQYRKKRLLEQE